MNRHFNLVAISVGLLAAIASVVMALYITGRQSAEEEQQQATVLAGEILRRSNQTTEQIIDALTLLHGTDPDHPCSAASIAVMQQIDLHSTYLQNVGHIKDGYLDCTAMGQHTDEFPVGKVDYISKLGYDTRTSVELPPGSAKHFVISEKYDFAAIIAPDLTIDVFVDRSEISLGTFSVSSKTQLLHRGTFNPAWPNKLGDADAVAFFDGEYTVAIRRSAVGDFAAYAALPSRDVKERLRIFAWRFIPLGALVGLAFAALFIRLSKKQNSVRAQLKMALKRDELYLLYQPVVDLKTGDWCGAEALLRWRRNDIEFMRPDIFIPVAESSDLIEQITARAMQLAALDMRAVFKQFPSFHVAINVSARDITSNNTLHLLSKLIKDADAAPHNIVIEATERGFLRDDNVRTQVAKIRATGSRIAIDDFGTGYSSLSYLQTFEIDFLKIDKSFVDTIGIGAATSNVVHHIIEMAKSLNLQMIAEGVETEAQAHYLRERGVQYAQGWLFARPMSAIDLASKLGKRTDE